MQIPLKITRSICPNFGYPKGNPGRNGQQIIAIVNHVAGGYWNSNYNWIMNPTSNASYHYYVKKTGEIVQFVEESNASYANGRIEKPTWRLLKSSNINPNLYTIAISREGHNHESLTNEQYKSILELHQMLISKYNIPITRDHIIGHYMIDSINRAYCPGHVFPWDKLLNDLKNSKTPVVNKPLPKVIKWQETIVRGKSAEEDVILLDVGTLGNPQYKAYAPVRYLGDLFKVRVDFRNDKVYID